MIETNLKSKIYNKDYYLLAKSASLDFHKNPGLKTFKIIANNKETVLECGCGEGTKLSEISKKSKKAYGVDFSSKAIKMAKISYPKINFKQGNIENLPYKDESFDFVYTAFVLEHLENPELTIKDIVRVTKKGMYIGLICPNFGSFCYRSPCNKDNLFIRSVRIILRDVFICLLNKKNLYWDKVESIADENHYKPDWDTTIEPSLITTLNFLRKFNIQIIEKSSLWELYNQPKPKINIGKNIIILVSKVCCFLGKLNIYPFKYWGPQLFIVMRKL